jgi:hypothetical protein
MYLSRKTVCNITRTMHRGVKIVKNYLNEYFGEDIVEEEQRARTVFQETDQLYDFLEGIES